MSYVHTGSPLEEFERWEDFVLWNEDRLDSQDTHQNSSLYFGAQDITAESPYTVSAPPTIPLEYNVSDPGSMAYTSASSAGCWSSEILSTFSSSRVSPLMTEDERRQLELCNDFEESAELPDTSRKDPSRTANPSTPVNIPPDASSTTSIPGHWSQVRSVTIPQPNKLELVTSKHKSRPAPPSAYPHAFDFQSIDSRPGRIATSNTLAGVQGRLAKGRKKGLDPKQRSEAALMRLIGSCSNCRQRKEKCDSGKPCKSCIKHYQGDLIHHPCVRIARLVQDMALSAMNATKDQPRTGVPSDAFEITAHKAAQYAAVEAWVSDTLPSSKQIDLVSAVPIARDASAVGGKSASSIERERIASSPDMEALNVEALTLERSCEGSQEGSGQSHSDVHNESDDFYTQGNDNVGIMKSHDEVTPYLEAFRFFNLSFGRQKYVNSDKNYSPIVDGDSNRGAGSDRCCLLPDNAGPSDSSNTASSASQNIGDDVSASRDNGTKLKARGRRDPASKPLDLLCWHAANGIPCKGQIGRSVEVRRLYSDHSLSRHSNTHKLPPPCARCQLMFESTTAALEHETVLRSASPCPILSEEVVNKNNSPLERAGISAQKDDAVKSALRDFRGSVKNRTDPRLPPLCDPVHFRIWVDRNVPLYIGKSNTRHEIAMKELSEWYIIFSALFPGDEIPTNPFAESKQSQNSRLLELLETGLIEQADNGTFPVLNESQLTVLRAVFHRASSTLEDEMLREQSFTCMHTTQSRKRRRPDSAPSVTTNSTSEPNVPLTPPITDLEVVSLQKESANASPLGTCDRLKSPSEIQQLDGSDMDLSAFSAEAGALWEFPDLFTFPDQGANGYDPSYSMQENNI